ncbi:MAG TPA: flagellar filament capping protein FliD, partial [Anaerolineaceae bacterium]|nr:flagellar filament capping protein FliD [Anaerolineaceae bacterium]
TGTFTIGTSIPRTQQTTALLAGTVGAFATGEPASGQAELATGSYFVETRQDAVNGWQFRLVDADGEAVSIQQGSSGTSTSDWQAFPAGGGAYDTGRGLQITFGTDPALYAAATRSSGAAQVAYQGQSAAIEVKTSDSLIDIAARINQSVLAGGSKVIATVVDSQLLLSMDPPGLDNELQAKDLSGGVLAQLGVLDGVGGFKNVMQTPANAVFYVNDLRIERSKNTGLTDVINGLTLNLAADAEGKSATLQVVRSVDQERKALDTFVEKYNDLMAYLTEKVATTKLADDTYKRGALAGDMMFSSFRYDLLRLLNADHPGSGGISNLRQLGFAMNDNFKLSLSSASSLEAALKENKTGVSDFVDRLMGRLSEQLDRFSGSSGYVKFTADQLDTQLKETNSQIATLNERLAAKEESLRMQFAEVQAQLMLMTYQSQQFSAMYGNVNTYQ